MQDLPQLTGVATRLDVVLLLVLILVGGFRGWWVFGWIYTALVKDRDEWKTMAISGVTLADRSVTVLEKRPGAAKGATS